MDKRELGTVASFFALRTVLRVLIAQVAANSANPEGWITQLRELAETEVKNAVPPDDMPADEGNLLIELALQSVQQISDITVLPPFNRNQK